jgi:pilus assembly protein Flp/PilA
MKSMLQLARRFTRDTHGATAVEYAIIAAMIGVGLVAVLGLFGNELGNAFNRLGNTIKQY